MVVQHFLLFSPLLGSLAFAGDEIYDLTPRFVEGQVWTVDDNVKTTIISDTFPGRRQEQFISFRKKYRIEKIHEDGRVEQTMRLEMLSREGQSPFSEMDWSQISDVPITMILEKEGSILEIQDPAGLDDASRSLFSFFKQIMLNNQHVLFLPEKPVSLDDTWNKTEALAFELPMFGPVDEVLQITGSLNAVKEIAGHEVFEINFSGVHSGSIGDSAQGTIEGHMQGTMLWESERGLCHGFDMEGEMKMVVVTDDGDILMEIKSVGTSEVVQDTAVR